MTRELYTTSRLRVLRTCPRRHYLRYRLGIVDAGSEATAFGSVAHHALEAWYREWHAGRLASRIDVALHVIAESALSPVDKARLSMLLVAYDLRWGAKNWEIVAIEVEFRYAFADYDIGGKIDAIIRDLDDGGRLYVVEHKTTGWDASPGSAYWEKLTIDCQLSIYVDGASVLGFDVAGCIYDVLGKPTHELALATPPDKRRMTQGKQCKLCRGTGEMPGVTNHAHDIVKTGDADASGPIVDRNGEVVLSYCRRCHQGEGTLEQKCPAFAEAGPRPCAGCGATGWKDAPKLYAGQRDTDETIEAFTVRVGEAIAERMDGYLMRETIVRPVEELERMRGDLIDWIRIDQASRIFFAIPPRNDDACFKFNQRCPYLSACRGEADINDLSLYPRGAAHPELAAV